MINNTIVPSLPLRPSVSPFSMMNLLMVNESMNFCSASVSHDKAYCTVCDADVHPALALHVPKFQWNQDTHVNHASNDKALRGHACLAENYGCYPTWQCIQRGQWCNLGLRFMTKNNDDERLQMVSGTITIAKRHFTQNGYHRKLHSFSRIGD